MASVLPTLHALDLDQSGSWLTVWFNTPENRNALTDARVTDLLKLCAALREDRTVRGVIFRGHGGVFCAGGDLKSFREGFQSGGADRAEVVRMSLRAADLFDAVASLPQYTVMAIEGAAMAGGMGLACCGDHVIATDGTLFGLSEVRIGLTPAQIAPFVLRRLGLQTARKLMMTGARLKADEALRLGLLDEVAVDTDALDAALHAQRELISGVAPGALASIKQQLACMPFQTRDEQRQHAAEAFADRMLSDEARDGIGAFFDKRKPNWAEDE